MVELNLFRAITSNRKHFCRYISSKQKTKENMSPVQKEKGDLVTWTRRRLQYSMTFIPPSSLAGVVTLP